MFNLFQHNFSKKKLEKFELNEIFNTLVSK